MNGRRSSRVRAFRTLEVMRALLIALVLASVPFRVLAQSDQDWRSCKALDADHLVVPACSRLIETSRLVQSDLAIAYALRGAAHWRQRDSNAAITDANQAIKINPNLATAYVTRSEAYGGGDNDDQAIDDASKAIEIDPNLAPAYSNRGIARARKGDVAGAVA